MKVINNIKDIEKELLAGNMITLKESITTEARYYRYNNVVKELEYTDDKGQTWEKSNYSLEDFLACIDEQVYISVEHI